MKIRLSFLIMLLSMFYFVSCASAPEETVAVAETAEESKPIGNAPADTSENSESKSSDEIKTPESEKVTEEDLKPEDPVIEVTQAKVDFVPQQSTSSNVDKYSYIGTVFEGYRMKYPNDIEVGKDGRIYVSDLYTGRVIVFDASHEFLYDLGGIGNGPGQFNPYPHDYNRTYSLSLALYNDDILFVSDTHNSRINIFNNQGKFVDTLTASDLGLDSIGALAVDSDESLYVLDPEGKGFVKIDKNKKVLLRVNKGLSLPQDITLDSKGNVYISDLGKNSIFVFNSKGKSLGTIGGKELVRAKGIHMAADDNLYVKNCAPGKPYEVIRYSTDGDILDRGWKSPSRSYWHSWTQGLAMDAKGNLLISDEWRFRVRVADNSQKELAPIGNLSEPEDFAEIRDMTRDSKGNIYLLDAAANNIRRVDSREHITATWKVLTDKEYDNKHLLRGIALNSKGDMYILESSGRRVIRLDSEGRRKGAYEIEGKRYPMAIAIDRNDQIHVAFSGFISTFDSDMKQTGTFTFNTKGYGRMGLYAGEKYLYLSDSSNDSVKIFTLDGKVVRNISRENFETTGHKGPYSFYDLTVDSKGNIFVLPSRSDFFFRIDVAEETLEYLEYKFEDLRGIQNIYHKTLVIDSRDNLFIGLNHGLEKYNELN